jgi:hypothetical protein
MTDTTNNQPAASKAPTHVAYHIRDRENGDSIWTRIGAAWPHADGKGFNLQIETVPLDGRITRLPNYLSLLLERTITSPTLQKVIHIDITTIRTSLISNSLMALAISNLSKPKMSPFFR